MDGDKRTDIQIYELAYNPVNYGFWDNTLYTPIQCGTSRSQKDVCKLKDNTGDNISDKNFYYSETTGTYWLWKNAPDTKYIGQCQYRRRLEFSENFNFDEIFDKYKIITAKPLLVGRSLGQQMQACHPYINIDALFDTVREVQPYYLDSFKETMNKSCALFYSSSYILPYDDFHRYCNFCFSILNGYASKFNFLNENVLKCYVESKINTKKKPFHNKPTQYHMLIGGFLQERIFSTWILSNFKQSEIYYKDFKFMESGAKP